MSETGWYWLPAEKGDKTDWHPAFYDRERGRMWLAECDKRGWVPRPEHLVRPATLPGRDGQTDPADPGARKG